MRLVRFGLFIAITVILAAPGVAAPIDLGSIADINAGTGTVTIGDKTFGDFASAGIDEDKVNVLGDIADDGTVQILFQGGFVDTFDGDDDGTDYSLFYSVTAGPGFDIIGITQGFSLSGGGDVLIGENVWENGFFSGLVANSTVAFNDALFDAEDPLGEAFQGDDLLVPNLTKVYVTKDIFLRASEQGGQVGATIITQGFIQEGAEVPEPTTMLLFSSALLGLGFMRRLKKN